MHAGDEAKIIPAVQVAYIGGSIEIHCRLQTVIWMHNWRELPKQAVVIGHGNKIKIENLMDYHDGNYICIDQSTRQLLISQLRVGCK